MWEGYAYGTGGGYVSQKLEILTIGRSTLSYDHFLDLLRSAGVTAVADVRSTPYSKHFPHFARDLLQAELSADRVTYRYLGQKLGGRPTSKALYCDGVADYEKMAQTDSFRLGLEEIVKGGKKHRLAIMCSEYDPLDCHRCLLVGRSLSAHGVSVGHIRSKGDIESQEQVEERLLRHEAHHGDDLFCSREELLTLAYRKHTQKVAYREPTIIRPDKIAAE